MKRWVKVNNEVSKEHLFDRNETPADTEGAGADTEESVPIDSTIVRSGHHSDDIACYKVFNLIYERTKR